MKGFFKKLSIGLKWIALVLLFVGGVLGVWVGSAWGLGCLFGHSFDMAHYGPLSYIALGSFLLVFVVLINIITLVLAGWALFVYGRARGIVKFSQRSIEK